MARKVVAACGGDVRGKTVAVLGLTFKPNTDDMRDAPSLALIQALQDAGARVRAFDPVGMEAPRQCSTMSCSATRPMMVTEGADALVIVTEWDAFRALDLERIRQSMAAPVFIDLRNIYRPDEVEKHGFSYTSVGRPKRREPIVDSTETGGSN